MAGGRAQAGRSAAGLYTMTAIWVLGVAGGTLLGLDLVARNEVLAAALDGPSMELRRQGGMYYEDRRHFADAEELLVLHEIPRADYSDGGVVFLGSSNMKTGLQVWTLSPELRRLIHNYGIGATNHTFIDQFLRYLVEERRLLAAGGEKTLVVFGLSYHLTGHAVGEGFFSALWRRHGLYEYHLSSGIRSREMSPRERFLRVERARVSGFIQRAPSYSGSLLRVLVGVEPRRRVANAEVYVRRWREFMGPSWGDKIGTQLREFSQSVDYLQKRGAELAVVLLPIGSWEERLPFDEPYTRQLRRLCSSRSVPVHDLRDILTDEEFADSVHANLDGMEKLHRSLVRIALPHLRRTGALPVATSGSE